MIIGLCLMIVRGKRCFMILSCQNLSRAFGTEAIIADASFHIGEREKAALVGINGAGKTTLLRMIVGELEPDSGSVFIAKGTTVGYLAQHQDVNSTATIYEELLAVKQDLLEMEQQLRGMEQEMKQCTGRKLDALMEQYNRISTEYENRGGYAVQSEVSGILFGLGFTREDFDKPISTLSGGQKTRVALGRLLLNAPDLLLLDEPTNHLDMNSISWLENYLLNYDKAMLVVSHDRYFLDKVVSKVIELDSTKVRTFSGNYSDYAQKKALQRESDRRAYLNQQQEIRHQEAVITKLKSFNREKSVKRAESREKMLEKMDVLDKPSETRADMHLCFTPSTRSGNDVLTIRHLAKSYPNHPLFSNLDFDIRRGEKVALIGDNGTGKTTILKIITGLETPDDGEAVLGSRVQIGYYDQEHQQLHPDASLFDEISDSYPDMGASQIRNVLASFLFMGEDVFKRVKDLSGGERGRLSLAKLMLSGANFLILDEPTNHLDITSREILEEALGRYEGTVLFVSHDRYFINQTASRILELKNHTLTNYLGNYDYYLEKAGGQSAGDAPQKEQQKKEEPATAAKEDWTRRKEEQAKKRRIAQEVKKTEERIAELEEVNASLEQQLAQEEVFLNVEKCTQVSREKESVREELEALYVQWETLSELDTEN